MTSYVAQLRSGRTATEFLLSEVGKNDLKRNLIGIRKTTFRSTKSHSKKKERAKTGKDTTANWLLYTTITVGNYGVILLNIEY